MPYDSCKTILLKCIVENKKLQSVSYLPVWIDDDTFVPEILTAEDPRFDEINQYMRDITVSQDIEPHFTVEGNEVRIV